jgi:hypothetical protein
MGLVGRGLKIALVIAPLMISSYIIGLPYGPRGVAFAYSAVMLLWLFPGIVWAVHGTVISFWDVLRETSRPLASIIPAAGLAFAVRLYLGETVAPLLRLVLENAILFITYFAVLMFVAGQKAFYLDLLRSLKGSSSLKKEDLISVL